MSATEVLIYIFALMFVYFAWLALVAGTVREARKAWHEEGRKLWEAEAAEAVRKQRSTR